MEYAELLGVNFVQTVEAPLGHVKIHPLMFAELLLAITSKSDEVLDIYIRKGVPEEPTLEEKLAQIKKG